MFESRPVLRDTGRIRKGRAIYELAEPLIFHLRLNGQDVLTITVPTGFPTDLASVPRLLWPWFPPDGPWLAAVILHDYLYGLLGCTRFLADALLRVGMAADGVPWCQRVLIYYAVRLFARRHKTRGDEPQKGMWP